MSQDYQAKINLGVVIDGLSEVTKLLGTIDGSLSFDQIQEQVDKAGRAVAGTVGELQKAKKATEGLAEATRESGNAAEGAAEGWEAYQERLEAIASATKAAIQNARMAKTALSDIPETAVQNMSRDERQNFIATHEANAKTAIQLARELEREQVAAEKRTADQTKRINDVAAKNFINNEKRRIAEAKRASDLVAKQWIEAEQKRIAAAEQRASAVGGRSYANASTNIDNAISQRDAESARFSAQLRRQMEETAIATDEASLASLTFFGHLRTGSSELPRLRYALYDVSHTAALTATTLIAAGAAVMVVAAQWESAFTNVERTLDGVSQGGVEELRRDLINLSEEIPRTFQDISAIATLGNQLGITSDEIVAFTGTVTRFSTVSGMTAEASAQAFGSLGELLNLTASQYEQLGSSIALVGRKSVATEEEIVTMTTRLAASATTAGFTAQQVIALAGSFASLRIAPERAQGVMEVYFNSLNNAVAQGGDKLDSFARVVGMTGDEVAGMVADGRALEFFEKFTVGLGQLDIISRTVALEDLGLAGIRAGEVFNRVSSNLGVFKSALGDANQGWSEGSELADQYSKVVDDLASRWQIFMNSLAQAGMAIGSALAPTLGTILDMLSGLLQGFANFASSPVGNVFMFLAGSVGVATAAIATLTAVFAAMMGSAAAMRTALAGVNFVGMAAQARTFATAVTTMNFSLLATGGAATKASLGVRAFRAALISTGIGALVVGVGTLIGWLSDLGNTAEVTTADIAGLTEAMAADTRIFRDTGEALHTFEASAKDAGAASGVLVGGLGNATLAAEAYLGIQDEAAGSTDGATSAIQDQTLALGENADAWIRRKLAEDPDFLKFANNEFALEAAERIGFDMSEAIKRGMSEDGGAWVYLSSMLEQERARIAAESPVDAGQLLGDLDTLQSTLMPAIEAMDALFQKNRETASALDYLGVAANGAQYELDSVGGSVEDVTLALIDAERLMMSTENALFALGDSLGQNAGMWSAYSEGGRANMGALYSVIDAMAKQTPGDAAQIAGNMQALYRAIIEGGLATAPQIDFMRKQIAALIEDAGGKVKAPTITNFSSMFSGISKGADTMARNVQKAGNKVKEEIRTLVDYAKDLGGIFSRSFEIRFGADQAMDDITDGWLKVKDAAAKAAKEAAEYRAELQELAADRSIKKYWLSVAENYGDSLRADKLRAEIAELDKRQADAKENLTQAQDEASMSLVGNSQASLQNRDTILGLVGGYQKYLEQLAASGMSQADLQRTAQRLRGEFMQQAMQAGFSRQEIEKYATSFDDMAVAIQHVPSNVTVTANPNPAIQALNEFQARAAQAAQNIQNSFNGINYAGGNPWDMGQNHGEVYGAGWVYGVGKNRKMMVHVDNSVPGGRTYQMYGDNGQVSPKFFRKGGWTGGVGVDQEAGIVHGQEYVMSAPAVKSFGRGGMEMIHQVAKNGGDFGSILEPLISAAMGGAGGGVMDLSAGSINAFANAVASRLTVILPGAQLAGSVGSVNKVNSRTGRA